METNIQNETFIDKNKGFLLGLSAFLIWGFVPLYWKGLGHLNALELLSYRILTSCIYLILILAVTKSIRVYFDQFRQFKTLVPFLLTSILISMNWGVFIYAASTGQVMQSSLGYFMVPLVNVLLGMIFLGERFKRIQNLAVVLLFLSVGWEISFAPVFPWISLTLGLSFGFYGLIRKKTTQGAFIGLALETTFLTFPAILFLLFYQQTNDSHFFQYALSEQLYIALAGVISILPLALFGKAASYLKLSTLGLMNYLTPTIHFILAIVAFDQTADLKRLITFIFIWLALFLYSIPVFLNRKATQA